MSLLLIFAALVLALFLSNHTQNTTMIAVIGPAPSDRQNANLKIIRLTAKPAKSQLALDNYAAVVDFTAGAPRITTLKNTDFKNQLAAVLAGKSAHVAKSAVQKSKAQQIIGFILMFLLMAGVTNAFIYTEDKEKHLMERIIGSSVSQGKLFLSYVLFLMTLLFVPVWLIFIVLNKFFRVDLGLSLGYYAVLLGIICLIGVSFALCNAAFFKDGDQASMIGSMILVITSLVSGSFFSLSTGHPMWSTLTNWLPQKQILTLTERLSLGQSDQKSWLIFGYLLLVSVLLLMIAVGKNRQTYLQ